MAVLKHLQPGILKATQHQNLLVFLKVKKVVKKSIQQTEGIEREREREREREVSIKIIPVVLGRDVSWFQNSRLAGLHAVPGDEIWRFASRRYEEPSLHLTILNAML